MVSIIFFRSYSGDQTISDISGEVDGHESRFGKIGLNWLNKILKKYGVEEQIPDKKLIENDSQFTDRFLKSEIERMVESLPRLSRNTSKSFELTRSNLVSKYQSLKISEILLNLLVQAPSNRQLDPRNRNKVDDIVQDLFYYAMAIKNSQFTCPMYVRIVTI